MVDRTVAPTSRNLLQFEDSSCAKLSRWQILIIYKLIMELPLEFLPNPKEVGYSGGDDFRDAFTPFIDE